MKRGYVITSRAEDWMLGWRFVRTYLDGRLEYCENEERKKEILDCLTMMYAAENMFGIGEWDSHGRSIHKEMQEGNED